MKEVGAVNINTHLKGAVVLDANTARKLGNVTDVLINPDKGVAMALLFRTSFGAEYALAPRDVHIHSEANAVIAFGEPVADSAELRKMLEKGVQAQGELVNSEVVTKDGRLMGRVSGVFLQTEQIAIATDEAIAQAEQLTLKSVDGKELSLADHRGQVVVLTFNADWTPLTNKSLPALQLIANLYKGRGVVFYWVSINSAQAGERNFATDADLKAFAQKNGLALTVLRAPQGKAFSEFGLDVIPSVVILDRAGKVYKKQVGFDTAPTRGYKSVIRALNRLLKNEPTSRPHARI